MRYTKYANINSKNHRKMVIFNSFSKRMSFRGQQLTISILGNVEKFQKEVDSKELSICILIHLFPRKLVYTGDWPLTLFHEVVLFYLEQRSSVCRRASR